MQLETQDVREKRYEVTMLMDTGCLHEERQQLKRGLPPLRQRRAPCSRLLPAYLLPLQCVSVVLYILYPAVASAVDVLRDWPDVMYHDYENV